MFTGIIEEIGHIREIIPGKSSVKLTVHCAKIMDDLKIGDSVATNGICLTVTRRGADWFGADVMPETMRTTGLLQLKRSDPVNLERALRVSDRLGGHIVTGHIDGAGVITAKSDEDIALWLTVKIPENLMKYIVPKGAVALDGTSLTVAEWDEKCFKVSLIPLTRSTTVLGNREIGDMVNVECDLLGKYIGKLATVNSQVKKDNHRLSTEFLTHHGFI